MGGSIGVVNDSNPHAIPQEWLQQVNNEGIVHWEGRVPFSRILNLLDLVDVVVLPTYYPEGVPRTLIEAASKGKAIITTDAPGCRDVVENGGNGFLVPTRDVESLAARMCEFIKRPELTEAMGKEGRKRAVEMFDEKIVFKKTLEVYERALAER
jgi:glycosyltransferase involved in cell wall biosynthesis